MLDQLVDTYGLDVVAAVAAGLALFYVVHALYAAREGIRWFLRAALLAAVAFAFGMAVLPEFDFSKSDTELLSGFAAVTVFALTPKRSRYIPAGVKRKVIARDLKGGKYNSKKHHIDHIWPFASGGSSTADNLRVISKKKNLRKGAKKPSLRDWF
jgi:hypothetical protein